MQHPPKVAIVMIGTNDLAAANCQGSSVMAATSGVVSRCTFCFTCSYFMPYSCPWLPLSHHADLDLRTAAAKLEAIVLFWHTQASMPWHGTYFALQCNTSSPSIQKLCQAYLHVLQAPLSAFTASAVVTNRVQTIMQYLQQLNPNQPNTQLILVAILPRADGGLITKGAYQWPNKYTDGIASVNSGLEAYAAMQAKMHYLDCSSVLLPDGKVRL